MANRSGPRAPARSVRQDPDIPDWIRWPVRLLALIFVLPVRLGWAALVAVGRFGYRYLLRPIGWLLDRAIWRPLRWLFLNLLWRPLGWLGHYLLVVPVRWLFRVCRPGLRVVGRALVAVARWIGRGLQAGWRVVGPGVVLVGRVLWAALVWSWRVVGAVLGFLYRLFVRPIGLAVAWLWRVTIAPAGRWVRDVVWRPLADATRDVLVALGLRRAPRPSRRAGRR